VSPGTVQLVALLAISGGAELVAESIRGLYLAEYRFIFLPLNDSDEPLAAGGTHWGLLVYSRDTATYHLFDSAAGSGLLLAAAKRVQHGLSAVVGCRGKLVVSPCAQQTNGYDCGAFTVRAARRISAQLLAAGAPAAAAADDAFLQTAATAHAGDEADAGLEERRRLAGLMLELAAARP
jgi:hypothetical protein